MTPAHPEAFGTGRLLFSQQRSPHQPRVLSHTRRERVREGEIANIISRGLKKKKKERREPTQTQLGHKLRVCKVVVSKLQDSVSGINLSSKETAAILWERRRQLLEAALRYREGGVCETTGRRCECSVTN